MLNKCTMKKVILLSFCTVSVTLTVTVTVLVLLTLVLDQVLVTANLPPSTGYVQDQQVERECRESQVQDKSVISYVADCGPTECKLVDGNKDAQRQKCSIENYLHNNPKACADLERNKFPCHISQTVDEKCMPRLTGLNLYLTVCKGPVIKEPSLNFTFQLPNCVSEFNSSSSFQAVKVDFQADCNQNQDNFFCKTPICRVFNYTDSYSQEWFNYTELLQVWYDCMAVGLKDGKPEIHFYLSLTHFPTEAMLNYSLVFRDVGMDSMRLAAAAWLTRQEAVVVFQPIPGIDKYRVNATSQEGYFFEQEVTSHTFEITGIESSYNIVTVTITPADYSKCQGLFWNCSPVSVTLPDKNSVCLPGTVISRTDKLPTDTRWIEALVIFVTGVLSFTLLGLTFYCYRRHTRGYRNLIAIASLPEREKKKVIHVLNRGNFKLHFLQGQEGIWLMRQAKIILVFLFENDPGHFMVEKVKIILQNRQLWGKIWIVSVGKDQHLLSAFRQQEIFSDYRYDEFFQLMSGRERSVSDKHNIKNFIKELQNAYDEAGSDKTDFKQPFFRPSSVVGNSGDLQKQTKERPRRCSFSSRDSLESTSELTGPSGWQNEFRKQANATAPMLKEPIQPPESLSGQSVDEDMDDEALSVITDVSSVPSVYRQMKYKENTVAEVQKGFAAIPEGEPDYDEPYERSDDQRSLDRKQMECFQVCPTNYVPIQAIKLQALASENRQNFCLRTAADKNRDIGNRDKPLPSEGTEHPSVQNQTSSSSAANLQSTSPAFDDGNAAHPSLLPSAYPIHTVDKLHQNRELKEAEEFPFTYYNDTGPCDSMEVLTSSNYCPSCSESGRQFVPHGDFMPFLHLFSSMNSQASNINEEVSPQQHFNGHNGGSFGTEHYRLFPVSSGVPFVPLDADEQTTPKSSIDYELGAKNGPILITGEQTNQHLRSPSIHLETDKYCFERPELLSDSFSISDTDDFKLPFPAITEGPLARCSDAENESTESDERGNSVTTGSKHWKTQLQTLDQESGQRKMYPLKPRFQERLEEEESAFRASENPLAARGVSQNHHSHLDSWSPTVRESEYGRVNPDHEIDKFHGQISPAGSQQGPSSRSLQELPGSFPQVCGPPKLSTSSGSRPRLSPSGGFMTGVTGPAGASSACRETEIPLVRLNGMPQLQVGQNGHACISSFTSPRNSPVRSGHGQVENGLQPFLVRRPPVTSVSDLNQQQNPDRVCGPPIGVLSRTCLEDDEDDNDGNGCSLVQESRQAPFPKEVRKEGQNVLDRRPSTPRNSLAEHHIDFYPYPGRQYLIQAENASAPEFIVHDARAREPVEDVYISDYESGISLGNSNSYSNSNF